MIEAGHRGLLVTAVDRMSKYTIIQAVPNRKVSVVAKVLVSIALFLIDRCSSGLENAQIRRLKVFIGKVLTITADFYFGKPYQSWQRGLNEHTNGLIRQYLPKTMPFNRIDPQTIDKIERHLNNRP